MHITKHWERSSRLSYGAVCLLFLCLVGPHASVLPAVLGDRYCHNREPLASARVLCPLSERQRTPFACYTDTLHPLEGPKGLFSSFRDVVLAIGSNSPEIILPPSGAGESRLVDVGDGGGDCDGCPGLWPVTGVPAMRATH